MPLKPDNMSVQRLTRVYLKFGDLVWAAFGALLVGGCGFLIDRLFHKADRLLASDFYTCGVAFLFCCVVLQLEGRRRAALARRMEIAAEVNHHIRNALTGVVFTAAARNDPALHDVLQDATERIDWVLNTVLPDGSVDLQWPVQAPLWRPASWAEAKDEANSRSTAPPRE